MTFVTTWMNLLSEISQIEKDKYCMFSLICGNLKNKIQQIQVNRNSLKEAENRLVVAKRERSRGRGKNG